MAQSIQEWNNREIQPVKNFKGYVLLSRQHPIKFCKCCLPEILLGPFLNTLSQMYYGIHSVEQSTKRMA